MQTRPARPLTHDQSQPQEHGCQESAKPPRCTPAPCRDATATSRHAPDSTVDAKPRPQWYPPPVVFKSTCRRHVSIPSWEDMEHVQIDEPSRPKSTQSWPRPTIAARTSRSPHLESWSPFPSMCADSIKHCVASLKQKWVERGMRSWILRSTLADQTATDSGDGGFSPSRVLSAHTQKNLARYKEGPTLRELATCRGGRLFLVHV
jgi:hypothetical protein